MDWLHIFPGCHIVEALYKALAFLAVLCVSAINIHVPTDAPIFMDCILEPCAHVVAIYRARIAGRYVFAVHLGMVERYGVAFEGVVRLFDFG